MHLKLISMIVAVLCSVSILINNAIAYDVGTASGEAVRTGACEQSGGNKTQATASLEKQIDLLEIQNRLLEEHNQRLLTTVHWALGFSAVFLLAVLGMTGYFTYRRYDQDKESLKTFLVGEVTKARTELEGRLYEWENKLTEKNREEFQSLTQSQDRIAMLAVNAAVEPLKSKIETLKRDFSSANIEILELRAWEFVRKRNSNGAILSFYRAAKKGFELKCYLFVDFIILTNL